MSISGRGGKRKGSGRPKREQREGKPPKVVLSCRVEAETVAFLKQEEQRTNKSIGELVDLAVEAFQENAEELPSPAIESNESETQN